jgi:hypothetical protein
MGREARGVRGMMLEDGQKRDPCWWPTARTIRVLTATENGFGKRTPIAEYTRHGRGTKGMIAIQTSERNGKVVAAVLAELGETREEIMLISTGGVLIRTRVDRHSRHGPLDPGRDADQPRRGHFPRRRREGHRNRREDPCRTAASEEPAGTAVLCGVRSGQSATNVYGILYSFLIFLPIDLVIIGGWLWHVFSTSAQGPRCCPRPFSSRPDGNEPSRQGIHGHRIAQAEADLRELLAHARPTTKYYSCKAARRCSSK